MSIHWSVETSCMMSASGKSGARRSGVTGSLVPGRSGGRGCIPAPTMAGMMLYQAVGRSSVFRLNWTGSAMAPPSPWGSEYGERNPRQSRPRTCLGTRDGNYRAADPTERYLDSHEVRVDGTIHVNEDDLSNPVVVTVEHIGFLRPDANARPKRPSKSVGNCNPQSPTSKAYSIPSTTGAIEARTYIDRLQPAPTEPVRSETEVDMADCSRFSIH